LETAGIYSKHKMMENKLGRAVRCRRFHESDSIQLVTSLERAKPIGKAPSRKHEKPWPTPSRQKSSDRDINWHGTAREKDSEAVDKVSVRWRS
jgi:hypothetical protein